MTFQNTSITNDNVEEDQHANGNTYNEINANESKDKRCFTIEVEFKVQNDIPDDEHSGTVLQVTHELIKA